LCGIAVIALLARFRSVQKQRRNGMDWLMRYRIGILERDRIYLARLVEFLRSHHSDSLEVHIIENGHMDWNNMDLEDLDMDVVSYDALFVGEGIDLGSAVVPPEVKIAYLVTQGYGGDSNKIIKYQRLEQIYQQIMAVCADEAQAGAEQPSKQEESAKPVQTAMTPQRGYHRFDDFVLDTAQIEGGIYKVYSLPEEGNAALNEVEMGMLINNQIDGLAEVTWLDNMVYYQITNKISLLDFVRKNRGNNGKNKVLRVVANIFETMQGLDEYMLLPDKVVLKPEFVYLDESTMKTALLYCPLQDNGEEQDMAEFFLDWIGICEELMDGLDNTNTSLKGMDYTCYIPSEQIQEKLHNIALAQESQGLGSMQKKASGEKYRKQDEDEPFIWETEYVEPQQEGQTAWQEKLSENVEAQQPEWESKTESDEIEEGASGITEIFDNLQYAAEESRRAQKRTTLLQQKQNIPYLVREKTGEKILINRNIFKLGKDANYVDYCIKDNPTVSRSHADIIKGTEGCYIVDKGSLNHTFLNGRRIEAGKQEKLFSGDIVQIADEVFEFMVGNQ
jgi:hypothetical protein